MAIFDLIDENDQKIGKTASYEEVLRDNLWHRSAYVIITTDDGRVIMQKRANGLRVYPNEVEMSVGGGVEQQETPEQAIKREIEEELGIKLLDESLVFLGRYKFNHPGQRSYIYTYTTNLPTSKIAFEPAAGEVADVFSLSLEELKLDLVKRKVDGVGKIAPLFGFWDFLVKGIESPKPVHNIHFVCRGNTFRSRIAETIVNTKKLKNFQATSSGIEADTDIIISPWAGKVLGVNHLTPTIQKPHKTDVSSLGKTDVIVVMSKDVLKDAEYLHDFNPIVWDVADIDSRVNADLKDLTNPELLMAAEQVFAEIDFNSNKLLDELAKLAGKRNISR